MTFSCALPKTESCAACHSEVGWKEKAKFDILDLNPLKNNISKSYIPAYFISADRDELIPPHHAKKLHDGYPGDKTYKLVSGTHNSPREQYVIDSIVIFFINCFSVSGAEEANNYGTKSMMYEDHGAYESEQREIMRAIQESLKVKNKIEESKIFSESLRMPDVD